MVGPPPASTRLPGTYLKPEATVAAGRQGVYSMALVLLALVFTTNVVEAQVGIRSGLARVTLVARRAPEGSIQSAGPAQQTGRVGQFVEASAMVRFRANSGYQLMVRGIGTSSARIWVQDVNGEYRELTGASPVTVARGSHTVGQWEREVRYRLEVGEGAELAGPLPVRYEMRVNPTM